MERIRHQQRKSLMNVMSQVVTDTENWNCRFDFDHCTHTHIADSNYLYIVVSCSFFISGNTFAGIRAYILPAGMGTARHQIFQRQIKQNGGQTESALSPGVTHVVVDDNMDVDRALRLLKVHNVPSGVHLVKCTWLSLCISGKKLLDVGGYTLLSPMRSVT